MWSPISSTLVSGKRDAVLVDTFITVDQARALVDWVRGERQESNDDLRYARPRRPFLWRQYVLERFPRARLVATPDVVKLCASKRRRSPPGRSGNPLFPGQISDHLVIAEELTENVIDLEGHDLVVVPLGHTDTGNTTCLHVPSTSLVVAGERRLQGCPRCISPSRSEAPEWIAALDTSSRSILARDRRTPL